MILGWTHIRLWSAQLELDKTDFGFFNARRSSTSDDDILVKENTIDEFRVLNRAADLLHNADIPQVDIRGRGRDKTRYCGDGDGGKGRRVLRDNLEGLRP